MMPPSNDQQSTITLQITISTETKITSHVVP